MTNSLTPAIFLEQLWQFYSQNGRHDMRWRQDTQPYYVLLSEVMLQQTQVERVKQKFAEFITLFPDWQSLANASQTQVVLAWQGLGYNRRALYLHRTAQIVSKEYQGKLPKQASELQELPGIGPNTAGAILAFAYNTPIVFIETNIRRVLLHEFFPEKTDVTDTEIIPILKKIIRLLPQSKFTPQTFYWAMMDYGTFLKQQVPNPNRRSKHYTKQSQFEGSDRQLRGHILRELLHTPLQRTALQAAISIVDQERFESILTGLTKEGFITQKGNKVQLR